MFYVRNKPKNRSVDSIAYIRTRQFQSVVTIIIVLQYSVSLTRSPMNNRLINPTAHGAVRLARTHARITSTAAAPHSIGGGGLHVGLQARLDDDDQQFGSLIG